MSGLLSAGWFALGAFAVFSILLRLLSMPVAKGWIGERRVHARLKNSLPGDTYKLFQDITLIADDGTTQIDHLIVSKYGLFVIETKNMSGWIFGSERKPNWTQQYLSLIHI